MIGIVGGGVTGLAVARFATRRGWNVHLWDDKPLSELHATWAEVTSLIAHHMDEAPDAALDFVVVSPGVPPQAAPVRAARARGIEVVSEIELAARHLAQPICAITGTNGKTTVTTMVGAMLEASGIERFVGGNIGKALIDATAEAGASAALVVEVSSYQLEAIRDFRAHVAVLLNVTEDHFDRYDSIDAYFAAKARIFERQTADDVAILSLDDALAWSLRGAVASEVIGFGHEEVREGLFATDREIVFRRGGREERYDLSAFKLPGAHNRENAMAAVAAARAMGASQEACARVLATFEGLPHRVEFVREVRGKRYYNDSKATNVDAVARALECFEAPVTLIAGGRDKGGDYGPLRRAMEGKVEHAILIGESREVMARALGGACHIHHADSLEKAVGRAATLPCPTVLFSPACSSFDM
ncbi:MAG: UDP-N-acetylmuramoyl-L-alanine--D-glutamate ligase, partial [Myxococcales bacterium]|nr:UDP-N-acetylmuramoyl-L-alanine--D-glutamate ligase [Myxococcales bacterium]